MAILFDNVSNEYLTNINAVANQPFTLACWAYADEALDQIAINIGHSSLARIGELGFGVTNLFGLFHQGATTYETLQPVTPTYSLNTWHHLAGRYEIADRELYADGVSIATGTVNVGAMPVGITHIGAEIYAGVTGAFFSGRIAEAAVWDVSLSDGEIALLAEGFSPLFFQPQSLVAYWPLIALEDINDRVGGFNMTAVNTPVTTNHMPKIIYPAPVFISYPIVSVGDGGGPDLARSRLTIGIGR